MKMKNIKILKDINNEIKNIVLNKEIRPYGLY